MKAIKIHNFGDAPEVVDLFELRHRGESGTNSSYIARYRQKQPDGQIDNVCDYTGTIFFPFSKKVLRALKRMEKFSNSLYKKKSLRRYVRGHGKVGQTV